MCLDRAPVVVIDRNPADPWSKKSICFLARQFPEARHHEVCAHEQARPAGLTAGGLMQYARPGLEIEVEARYTHDFDARLSVRPIRLGCLPVRLSPAEDVIDLRAT